MDTALGRIGARGDTANEFEKRDYLQRCRDIFLSMKDEPYARLIDVTGSPDQVAETIGRLLL